MSTTKVSSSQLRFAVVEADSTFLCQILFAPQLQQWHMVFQLSTMAIKPAVYLGNFRILHIIGGKVVLLGVPWSTIGISLGMRVTTM